MGKGWRKMWFCNDVSVVAIAERKSEIIIVHMFVSQFQYKFEYIPNIQHIFNYMAPDTSWNRKEQKNMMLNMHKLTCFNLGRFGGEQHMKTQRLNSKISQINTKYKFGQRLWNTSIWYHDMVSWKHVLEGMT